MRVCDKKNCKSNLSVEGTDLGDLYEKSPDGAYHDLCALCRKTLKQIVKNFMEDIKFRQQK